MKNFSLLTQIGDKFGTFGAIVATMGCAMCFPALANSPFVLLLWYITQQICTNFHYEYPFSFLKINNILKR